MQKSFSYVQMDGVAAKLVRTSLVIVSQTGRPWHTFWSRLAAYSRDCLSASLQSALPRKIQIGVLRPLQYDGSKDDLDWRRDFRYLNFDWFIKKLGSMLIKDCFIEWIHLLLSNFNLWLDFIRILFFNVLTHFSRLGKRIFHEFEKKISSIRLFSQV